MHATISDQHQLALLAKAQLRIRNSRQKSVCLGLRACFPEDHRAAADVLPMARRAAG